MACLSLLFFLSGVSGLIYQVVWVRVFGNMFGNTVHSASLVVAVFMLGLGLGSYLVGRWADRQYAARPDSLLRWYAALEISIGAMGLGISWFLPHLAALSASTSAYSITAPHWFALSPASYAARVALAALLLTPITVLMGGTLTLLIRYCVRVNVDAGAWRIALLYAVNTAGAAAGAFLTDFAVVPAAGLAAAQWIAVAGNVLVGIAALALARRRSAAFAFQGAPNEPLPTTAMRDSSAGAASVAVEVDAAHASDGVALASTSIALALCGFAAMGMEILWFRHFTMLLGGFRAVFSLLLTVILIGIGGGALAGGWLNRKIARPVVWMMVGEGLFIAATLAGFASADVRNILTAEAYVTALPTPGSPWLWARLGELWLIIKPMLREVALPALVMGLTFPTANAIVQRVEGEVGRRAGVLYLANTLGAVCGSLAAGFVLLPTLGIQHSVTVLVVAAAAAFIPLSVAARRSGDARSKDRVAFTGAPAAAMLLSGAAIVLWVLLPADFVVARAQTPVAAGDRQLAIVEGVNEVVTVVERSGQGRSLLTNGHPMSSTSMPSQRYMRALAHIPLLSIERPEAALVICFGVGNTANAVSLHPTIRRLEIADLSRQVLDSAGYFTDANHNVLADPRVVVYVNDGRQHLRMQPAGTYDLIALEPPPIAQAGVGALYSTEFYRLVRERLKPNGYISQWLPAYQVPPSTTLAMIRAFVDVFPQAVLLSGTNTELLLLGTTAPRIEIDPARIAARLDAAPAVQRDLRRVGLGTVTEMAATFLASPQTLEAATRGLAPVTDDRPVQEYGAKSRLNPGYQRLPAAIFDLGQAASWCPKCFDGARPSPLAPGLDVSLDRLAAIYQRTLVAPQ